MTQSAPKNNFAKSKKEIPPYQGIASTKTAREGFVFKSTPVLQKQSGAVAAPKAK